MGVLSELAEHQPTLFDMGCPSRSSMAMTDWTERYLSGRPKWLSFGLEGTEILVRQHAF
jgi:hypothetical protein